MLDCSYSYGNNRNNGRLISVYLLFPDGHSPLYEALSVWTKEKPAILRE